MAPVFTSPTWAQTIVGASDLPSASSSSSTPIRPWSSTGMTTLLRLADAEQTQRPGQRDVALRADDDTERRRAGETALREVVADAVVDGVPGSGERT